MNKKSKGKTFLIVICSILSITLLGSIVFGLFPAEESKKKTYVKHTVIAELPITLEDCSATSYSGATDLNGSLSKVSSVDLGAEDESITGDFIKIDWKSGLYFTLDIDFENYDLSKVTHLSFWLYSDSTTFDTGKPLLVKDTTSTIFNTKKRMISADKTFEDILVNEPEAVKDNFFVFGTWNRIEVPIEDVLSFEETNNKVALFYTYSSGLTTTSIYVGGFELEKIETIVK